MDSPDPVVFSARETEWFTPPDSPRSYLLQPLTYRERSAMRRDLRRLGGIPPERPTLLAGLRDALRQIQPSNLEACLAVVDAAEAAPDDPAAQARLAVVEQAVIDVPAYAALTEAVSRHTEAVPWVAAQHALRGWRGPGLPAFPDRGTIPDEVLEQVPAHELSVLGWRAYVLAMVGSPVGPVFLSARDSEKLTDLTEAAALGSRLFDILSLEVCRWVTFSKWWSRPRLPGQPRPWLGHYWTPKLVHVM
jgi:hypothetical protein